MQFLSIIVDISVHRSGVARGSIAPPPRPPPHGCSRTKEFNFHFGPGQLTSIMYILSYEAGFLLANHPLSASISRIAAHAAMPGR
jgi:hypothetical protein